MSDIRLPEECVSVGIAQWRLSRSPVGLRSILGSCLGVVLYDQVSRTGGLAHILLPDSRGSKEHPGRYADTAIPALLEEFYRARGPAVRSSLIAKLAGGAKMFDTQGVMAIGEANHKAVLERLSDLKIPVQASDVGGEFGRNVTFDTTTGRFFVKRPGGVLDEVV